MKAVIYLRTSTLEQHPEKQKQECLNFAKNRGYEVIEIFEEKLSGWKGERPLYDKVKNMAFKGEIKAVIVWALDRWIRNRDTLLEDVTALKSYGVRLHSIKEEWLEAINIDGPLGKTVQDFLLGLVGSLGELESQRKSERVKMAHASHKGRKWGRPDLPESAKKEVIEQFKSGKSLREIARTLSYWDSNRNKQSISLGAVHKIVTDFKRENNRLEGVQ